MMNRSMMGYVLALGGLSASCALAGEHGETKAQTAASYGALQSKLVDLAGALKPGEVLLTFDDGGWNPSFDKNILMALARPVPVDAQHGGDSGEAEPHLDTTTLSGATANFGTTADSPKAVFFPIAKTYAGTAEADAGATDGTNQATNGAWKVHLQGDGRALLDSATLLLQAGHCIGNHSATHAPLTSFEDDPFAAIGAEVVMPFAAMGFCNARSTPPSPSGSPDRNARSTPPSPSGSPGQPLYAHFMNPGDESNGQPPACPALIPRADSPCLLKWYRPAALAWSEALHTAAMQRYPNELSLTVGPVGGVPLSLVEGGGQDYQVWKQGISEEDEHLADHGFGCTKCSLDVAEEAEDPEAEAWNAAVERVCRARAQGRSLNNDTIASFEGQTGADTGESAEQIRLVAELVEKRSDAYAQRLVDAILKQPEKKGVLLMHANQACAGAGVRKLLRFMAEKDLRVVSPKEVQERIFEKIN